MKLSINRNNSAISLYCIITIHNVMKSIVCINIDKDSHVKTNNNVFNKLHYTPVILVLCDTIVSSTVSDNISSPANPS